MDLKTESYLKGGKILPIGLQVRIDVEHWRDGVLLSKDHALGDICGTVGRDWLCQMVAGSDFASERGSFVRYVGLGTSLVPPAGTQTALKGEIYRGTGVFSKDAAVGSTSLDKSFAIGSTYAMNESGLFLQKAGGSMYCRGTFPTKNVNNGDTVNVNYTLGFL